MNDCRFVLTDVSKVAACVSETKTRMGQVQYGHAPHSLHDTELDVDQEPAEHNWHVATSVAATTFERVPPTHGTHEAAPDPDHPPAGQVVQLIEPKAPMLVPASHAMHADCPVYGLKCPLLHRAHTDAVIAAVDVELVPTGHAVHVSAPRASL
jgi:hypothetical protein